MATKEEAAKRRQRLKDKGLCVMCAKVPSEKSYCSKCQAKYTKIYLERRHERRQESRCYDCGVDVSDSKRCQKCHLKKLAFNHLGSIKRWRELLSIFEKQDGKCPYTGEKLVIGVNAELDHIHPLSKGGVGDIDNMQWLLADVNQMKHSLTPIEFLGYIKKILNHLEGLR